MCHSDYLSNKSNRKKFFDLLVEDLNALQATLVFIPTLTCQLNFAFTILAGDHLASNDIGGWRILQTLSYKFIIKTLFQNGVR